MTNLRSRPVRVTLPDTHGLAGKSAFVVNASVRQSPVSLVLIPGGRVGSAELVGRDKLRHKVALQHEPDV